MQKHVNLVDLVKSFPTNIYSQKSASIQPRTTLLKVHLIFKPWDLIFTEPPRPCVSAEAISKRFCRDASYGQSLRELERRGFLLTGNVFGLLTWLVERNCHLRFQNGFYDFLVLPAGINFATIHDRGWWKSVLSYCMHDHGWRMFEFAEEGERRNKEKE